MASHGSFIVETAEGLEIKGRRKFARPEAFDAMIDDLVARLTKQIEQGKKKVISDLDLSQNKLTSEQWENLFYTLQVAEATVVRFRLFGCATLNDEVMQLMADYFRANLDAETCPTEMHLSDCAITAEGFQNFMSALEETELYPKPNPHQPGKGSPLYLRLENNYISEETIQEKVEAGVVQPFTKNKNRSCEIEGAPKVNLVVARVDAGFQQKSGEPPAPEQAAPMKNVWDYNSQQQESKWGAAGGNSWGKGGGNAQTNLAQAFVKMSQLAWNSAKTSTGKGGSAPVAVALAPGVVPGKGAAPGKGAVPVVVPGKGAAGKGAAPVGPVVVPGKGAAPVGLQKGKQAWNPPQQKGGQALNQQQQQQQPQQTWQQQQQQKGKSQQPQKVWQQQPIKVQVPPTQGTAGTASDRSRTPAPRNGGAPQVVPPKKGKAVLPRPWEEHFSEEFNLPYYWNSETGDAIWEKKPGWP